ncbi:MAG: 4-(cytidine 5'-diphospho)-2-C-methyl-D-erythritol kinase [Gemmatimonadota bacterium]
MSARASVAAPAKVNLSLRILGARPDGFHDIDTLFQAIDLADEVSVELAGSGVHLEVHGADLGPVEENLAYRAAVRARSETGFESGLRVALTKRIPVGAGLGGGSSDAAAVLACVGALAGIDRGDPRLHRIASDLGSDVAFFLGSAALTRGTGRGELLEPLAPLPAADLVLVSPPVHVSSGGAYRALAEARREGHAAPPAAGADAFAPDALAADAFNAHAFTAPTSWREVAVAAQNDFETVISARHPEIARALRALREAGAELAVMTGSGSTSFGLFPDRDTAETAAAELQRDLGWPCHVAKTLTSLPLPHGS